MSWKGMTLLLQGFQLGLRKDAKVELGKLGEILFLRRYMSPEDERLDAEELGRRIDDGLVEYIGMHLFPVDDEEIDTDLFWSKVPQVEEGMRENLSLKAFAATLWKEKKIPLASETYLRLAKRHVLHGKRRAPSTEEGRQLVSVLLGPVRDPASWEIDWDIESFAATNADAWLNRPAPGKLQELLHTAKESPLAWDTLILVCKKLAERGEEGIPYPLLQWYFMASQGLLKRPQEGHVSHRPAKLGYKLRDNEIRHVVDLLQLVGMSKTAACSAVEKGFTRSEGTKEVTLLSERTIQAICQKRYSTFEEFREDAMKAIEPRYYLHLSGAEPDRSVSSSV